MAVKSKQIGFLFDTIYIGKSSEQEPFTDGKFFFTIKVDYPLTDNIPNKLIELTKELNVLHTESNRSDCHLYGILAWPPKKMEYKRFFADLPDNLDDLVTLSNKIEIPLNIALNTYFSKKLHLLAGIPITLVIPRPLKRLKFRIKS